MPKDPNPSTNFEQTLSELEKIIEQMEQGEMSLEDSLRAYERGMTLSQTCQKLLNEAEQRVQILSQQNKLDNFDTGQV